MEFLKNTRLVLSVLGFAIVGLITLAIVMVGSPESSGSTNGTVDHTSSPVSTQMPTDNGDVVGSTNPTGAAATVSTKDDGSKLPSQGEAFSNFEAFAAFFGLVLFGAILWRIKRGKGFFHRWNKISWVIA